MSFYNTYRPKTFASIKGSKSAEIISKQINLNKTAHSYILSGPPGTGKTTLARVIAMALFCDNFNDEPCGKCNSCVSIINDSHSDVYEVNCAVNNGVDHVRENIVQLSRLAPSSGKYKIFILDECHMLTNQAQTSLIKITEEPPPFVKFFFCTTEPNKILRAIQTRSQMFPMRKLSIDDMSELLLEVCSCENLDYEPSALRMIAREANGSARTSLSILEQCSVECVSEEFVRELLNKSPRNVAFSLIDSMVAKDRSEACRILQSAYMEGRDMSGLILECSSCFIDAYKYMALKTKKVDRIPEIECIARDVNSKHILEFAEQLYNISISIRQTVSEDIVAMTGVLKTIDWYAKVLVA
jgi:DNA polymerase-3 subunit gamma/tau